MSELRPGSRFYAAERWEDQAPGEPHVWRTLGYRLAVWDPGHTVVEWDAGAEYTFPADSGRIVHGGLVATLLDAAMGSCASTLLDEEESFLTADLRVEFLRSARIGLLRATGDVVRRARRAVFCAGELRDADGTLLAAGRAVQIVQAPAVERP